MCDVIVCDYLVYFVGIDYLVGVKGIVVLEFVVIQIGYGGKFDMGMWVYVDVVVGQEFCWVYMVEKDEWFDYLVVWGGQGVVDFEVVDIVGVWDDQCFDCVKILRIFGVLCGVLVYDRFFLGW